MVKPEQTTVQWMIGLAVGVAALIVALSVLVWSVMTSRMDSIERQMNSNHAAVTAQLQTVETRVGGMDTALRESQRVAALAWVIAARNHRDDTVVILTSTDDTSQSETVELLEYLDDIPRNVGRTLEGAAEDVGDELERTLERIIDLF